VQVFVVTKEIELIQSDELITAVHRCLGAHDLCFVVPPALVDTIKSMAEQHNFVRAVDERDILAMPLSEVAAWPVDGFPERAGWYYQQLIKLALAQSAIAEQHFLIWDADTIPYRRMSMFEGERLVFTRGFEFHRPYFETNRRLIGVDRSQGPRFSAISQHMPVDRTLMGEMLDFLAKSSPDGSWIGAIRAALVDRQGGSLLSEYELFADWLRVRHPERLLLRRLPWSRNGAILSEREIARAKKMACFIAFEEWDRWRSTQGYVHYKFWRELTRHVLGDWLWPAKRFDRRWFGWPIAKASPRE
jgi:hypothetical protein